MGNKDGEFLNEKDKVLDSPIFSKGRDNIFHSCEEHENVVCDDDNVSVGEYINQ